MANTIINLRFAEPQLQIYRIYTEALRQAILIYLKYGMNGILHLVLEVQKTGRGIVKEVEMKCLSNEYQ